MRYAIMILTILAMLAIAAPGAFAEDNASATPDKQACPKCKKEMDRTWKFCPFDGSPLEIVCPKCGRTFPATHKFCPFDATALPSSPAASETPQPSENASCSTPKNEKNPPADKEPEGKLIIDDKKPAQTSTSSNVFRSRLLNPQTAAESIVAAITQKDRRFLDTSILWTNYSEFYQSALPPEKKLAVDDFKKKFLEGLLADTPKGLAAEFALDLNNSSVEADSISIETMTATVVLNVKKGKTVTGKIEMTFRSIDDLWLATSMRGSIETVSEEPKPAPPEKDGKK